MLKCKVDPMDVNNLACAKGMHFKASAVVTLSAVLHYSDQLLVFTYQHNIIVD